MSRIYRPIGRSPSGKSHAFSSEEAPKTSSMHLVLLYDPTLDLQHNALGISSPSCGAYIGRQNKRPRRVWLPCILFGSL